MPDVMDNECVEQRGKLEIYNNIDEVYETFISTEDANNTGLQLIDGSIVWESGALTLTKGSEATVPSGSTLTLMVSGETYGVTLNTQFSAVIAEGATLTVEENGTLAAVSGSNPIAPVSSKITVNGTLDVKGTLSIAKKASVEVAEGGTMNLAGLNVSPILSFLLSFVLPILIFVGLGQYMSKKMIESAGGKNALSFGMGKSSAKVYVQSTKGIP